MKGAFLAWIAISYMAACNNASVGFSWGTICTIAQGLSVNTWCLELCNHHEFKVSFGLPSWIWVTLLDCSVGMCRGCAESCSVRERSAEVTSLLSGVNRTSFHCQKQMIFLLTASLAKFYYTSKIHSNARSQQIQNPTTSVTLLVP